MIPLPELEARFERHGPYMVRRGPAGGAGGRCPVNKKLCLYTTDRELIVRELDGLAARPECFFVKFSIEPRDGMYLGRAFFVDAELLGRLWAAYKPHPRMFCSVQDDDWANPFR